MANKCLVRVGCVVALAAALMRAPAGAADRAPLGPNERVSVLALIGAVDAAQGADRADSASFRWTYHVLKSLDQSAYVAYRLAGPADSEGFKSAAVYVRAVSRHEGRLSTEERSFVKDWLLKNGDEPAPLTGVVAVGPGELPVGVASNSSRRGLRTPAESSAALTLLQRDYERQSAQSAARKKQAESRQRDPYHFPFEDFYFVDYRSRTLERALSLPPGEYDLFVAIVDRTRLKTTEPTVIRHTLTIPDFWNDQLAVSSLIFATDVRALSASLSPQQQARRPYTFGRAEVAPVSTPVFTRNDVLSVVYQICNFGAPDADLTAVYAFYKITGDSGKNERTLFNRTAPQELTDNDLAPSPDPWQTQAMTMGRVPLARFPAGQYEIEVEVRDRLTRSSASSTAAFTVR